MDKVKEKVKELLTKYRDENYFDEETCRENSKNNSLILVKEMLNEHSHYTQIDSRWDFWLKVEHELNKL